ncbi:MAG: hypothetical protein SEPTF4163_001851 [Sporothrix epigloea]
MAVFRDIVEGHRQLDRARKPQKLGGKEKITPEEPDLELGQDEIRRLQLQHQEEQQKQYQEIDQPSAGRDSAASMELYNHLIKLTQMRSQPETSPATLFHFFEKNMYPHMTGASSRRLPNIFRQAAQQLMRSVSVAKQKDFGAADLPAVARITRIRRELDLLNMPASWAPLMLGLAADIVARRGDNSTECQSTQAALVHDLVEAWRMFSLPDVVVADRRTLDDTPSTEFRMPTPDTAKLEKYARRRSIQRGLACLFPRYAPPQMRELTPALLAMYAILTDASITPPEAKEQARELLDAVSNILSITNAGRPAAAAMFEEYPALGAYVLLRWPLTGASQGENANVASTRTDLATATTSSDAIVPDTVKTTKEARRATLDSIHQQLLEALRARNLQECETVWERFWAAVSIPDVEGVNLMRNSAEIFNTFIMAFTMMRMQNRAISVWNTMTTIAGIQPTLRTWTSFMVGYKRTSNPDGIRTIWAKLIASGIQVDTAVWTARISGLIESGDAAAGIEALKEMQSQWEEWERWQAVQKMTGAASGSRSSSKTSSSPVAPTIKAIKPTIEPVNAAIAGLLRKSNLVAAKKVLAWAGQHGIEPDIITFNTILRPLVRDGADEEVAGVLDMMRQRGINPDEATITILLDGTFGNGALADSSGEEQAEAVKQLLAEIEASGLDANLQTYAKIIYLLLEADTGNGGRHASKAVSVVLKRMRQRGLAASAHIYTILAEHYFACNPPDLEAVRSLIERGDPGETSQSSSSTSASVGAPLPPPAFDRVFWERVVRGFAQAGDTASAQRYFVNIADSLSVTSSTLEDLLRALIHNDEWEAAAALVAKVQAQKTLWVQGGNDEAATPMRALDARQFRHRFWHLAAEHGLLQLEPQQ